MKEVMRRRDGEGREMGVDVGWLLCEEVRVLGEEKAWLAPGMARMFFLFWKSVQNHRKSNCRPSFSATCGRILAVVNTRVIYPPLIKLSHNHKYPCTLIPILRDQIARMTIRNPIPQKALPD